MKKLLSVLTLLLAMAASGMAQNCNAVWTDTIRNGCTIQFYSYGAPGSNPPIHMYWQFGDGTTLAGYSNQGSSIAPTHTYASSGTYTVCLHLTDSINNCYNVYCDTVTVNCPGSSGPCSASFTGNATSQGCTWNFQSTSQNANYMQWWWNDGSPTQPIVAHHNNTVSHTFPGSGTYNVCLYLYDSTQQWCDSTCMTVVVNCQGSSGPCVAQFQSYPDTANPCTVYFWSQSTGASHMQWWWNDGSSTQPIVPHSSSGQTHTFPGSGTYNVCLYLYDSTQQWCDSTCMSVTVNCPTGISESIAISKVNVYPNPADDIVTIEAINGGTSDVEVMLTDVSGRRVYYTNIKASHNIRHTIPVHDYNHGIYMLSIRSGSSMVTEKLIIH